MRGVRAALFLGGVAMLAVLVVRVGTDPILSIVRRMAWWQFVLVCLPFAPIMAVDTLGWRYAFAGEPPPYWRMVAARTAGEALNIVTALGSVGGEAVKVWLLRPTIPYDESVPSVVIAKTTSIIAQTLFLLLGLIVAITVVKADRRIISAMLVLLGTETLLVGSFFAAQLTGLVRRAGRLLAWSGLIVATSHAERLDASLRLFYRRCPQRFLLSIGCHLCGWLLGVLEVMVMLSVLEMSVRAGTAAVVETLGSGVRFATFLVPGSLGVLEGVNTGVFAALGLGASAGLAFSLVRRAREVVWIGIGLLVLVAARTRAPSVGAVPRRTAR